MALANHALEASHTPFATAPLVLFEREPAFNLKDAHALIHDFFSWFEDEWKQRVIQTSSPKREVVLSEVLFPPPLDAEATYTDADLATHVGRNKNYVRQSLKELGIRPVGRLPYQRSGEPQSRGGQTPYLYLGRDCIDIVEAWKWKNLSVVIDSLWARFLPTPCGRCARCLVLARTSVFECYNAQAYEIKLYRASFQHFLQTIWRYESIASWWKHEQKAIVACSPGSITQHTGIVLLYLLDRHLLDLSLDELLQLRFPGMEYADLLRPWSNRRPEEYKSYLRGLHETCHNEDGQRTIHAILGLILMKYGFQGVRELGRRLTSEEQQQAVREKRLVTFHISYDVYLDFPMSDDIRVGHVALDEMRHYFWTIAWNRIQAAPKVKRLGRSRDRWEEGPRGWRTSSVQALERVLTAKVWQHGQALLPLRPETEKIVFNPYHTSQRAGIESHALHLLPATFQEILSAYVNYRYRVERVSIPTLTECLKRIIPFLCWVHENADLNSYTQWDHSTIREIVQAYLSARLFHVKTSRRYRAIQGFYHFFLTLARMGLAHPPGYQAIRTLLPSRPYTPRSIPREDVLDRIFNDGVCQLDYDPFARLALTIQYFCGTRVTETCDLPLFCLVEDADSQILYLVIPQGKMKEERSFPIAAVGMGPLLTYMTQVVKMQLAPGGDDTPLHASRMNVRYLETDTKKAFEWDYLFDRRLHQRSGRVTHQGVLNSRRAGEALQEALLFAAKKNPQSLFREETYSRRCRRQRRPGQPCHYVSLVDGITVCPICEEPLPGIRGHRCCRDLTRRFECDGVGQKGDYFCPKCDAPLAELVPITTHTFRHNSVTRAHRHGISLAQNMLLHGHKTIPMHLKYLHLLPQDQQAAVTQVFTEKFLQDIRLASSYAPGQVIVEGTAQTPSYEQLLELTLRQGLARGTDGLWGGFWTGALAEEGVVSPVRRRAQITLTEETYHHAVAQYRFEALGLAVSEVALERGTKGKFRATVAPFLERKEIERVVSSYLGYIQRGYLDTIRGVRLLEADIQAKHRFLNELAEMLQPWVQRYGLESIDQLVMELDPGTDIFQKRGGTDALDQEFPASESES